MFEALSVESWAPFCTQSRRTLAMFTAKGKFGWYELMTSDTAAAGKFYSDVVGWTTHEQPSTGEFAYTTFNLGDVGMAGMLNVGGHTAWIGYIAVEDVDAHIEKIVEAGGKLWKPATDVPGMLRFAVLWTRRVRRLWSSPPIRRCPLPCVPRRPPPARSVGTNSTRTLHHGSRRRFRLLPDALWLDQAQRHGYGSDGHLSPFR
jgi:predicted enzyme related to lactoylglutathione lyase